MYCMTRTLKYILCVMNLSCALFGALLFWYGIWLINNIIDDSIDHGETLASVLCLLLGTVIMLAAIYGTVGIFMESKTMLISFAVLLLVLLIMQFIMLSISYAAAGDALPAKLKQGFDELWDFKHVGNSTLQQYEEWLHCCGRYSAQDYFNLDKVPTESCCFERDCENVLNLYVDGCEQKFKEYVHSKTANFNVISWFLMLAELAGSVTSCYLVDSIRNHRDRVRFYN